MADLIWKALGKPAGAHGGQRARQAFASVGKVGRAPERSATSGGSFRLRLLVIAILGFAASGCVRPPPPEFATYQQAFEQLNSASRQALEIFEPIEKASRPLTQGQFVPEEAAYIADEGRPALSRQIETGLSAVAVYNTALARYAAGESGAVLLSEVGNFAASVVSLSTTVGAPVVGSFTAATVEALQRLAAALLATSDRAEFARAVAANSGAVEAFLVELRETTPDIYNVANTHAQSRRSALARAGRAEEAAQVRENLAAFRRLLANWVLAIDAARRSTGALEAAVKNPAVAASPAELALWASEIERYAEGMRGAVRSIARSF